MVLERIVGRRRFDALRAIFEQAASTRPGATPPEPVLSLLIDVELYEAYLAGMTGDDPAAHPMPDPADIDRRRCETLDGTPLDPVAIVAVSLTASVRRVVMGAPGVVIDLGRKRRLFTGSAREAAKLQGSRVRGPVADGPEHRSITPSGWTAGGPTDPVNSGPSDRHNLVKNRGFTVWRDELGRWHTYRPDGTEILAA